MTVTILQKNEDKEGEREKIWGRESEEKQLSQSIHRTALSCADIQLLIGTLADADSKTTNAGGDKNRLGTGGSDNRPLVAALDHGVVQDHERGAEIPHSARMNLSAVPMPLYNCLAFAGIKLSFYAVCLF